MQPLSSGLILRGGLDELLLLASCEPPGTLVGLEWAGLSGGTQGVGAAWTIPGAVRAPDRQLIKGSCSHYSFFPQKRAVAISCSVSPKHPERAHFSRVVANSGTMR